MKTKRKADSSDIYIGENLKFLRVSKSCSQKEIADELGISTQQYQKYEKGANKISASNIYRLANFFKVDVSRFFKVETVAIDKNFHFRLEEEAINAEMIKTFQAIKDPKIKKDIITLLKNFCENEQ
jgi:transcriptional regulator with XRE-family HTH domain